MRGERIFYPRIYFVSEDLVFLWDCENFMIFLLLFFLARPSVGVIFAHRVWVRFSPEVG